MNDRLKYHTHYDTDSKGRRIEGTAHVEPGCQTCREGFEKQSSVCGFCCREVTNKVYLSGDYHQSGKCRTSLVYKKPERTVDKPLTSPSDAAALGKVDYDNACKCKGGRGCRGDFLHFKDCKRYIPTIETYHDLAVWWGLAKPKKTKKAVTA